MRNWKMLLIRSTLVFALTCGLTSCGDDAEDVGEQIDDAVDETGDALEDAADELEDTTHPRPGRRGRRRWCRGPARAVPA